jgi:hypothetical protein
MQANKQIYIPTIKVSGSFMEEIGSSDDRIFYPGEDFSTELKPEDFKDVEEYHSVWIILTRAVKLKLANHATG